MSAPDVRDAQRRTWVAPALLALAVVVAYAPSLGGDFLRFDDDWLIADDPVMQDGSPAAAWSIVSDLSRETRLVLGAEYLPVRDLVTWALVRVVGMSAPALRVAVLALYVLAVLAWRAWFRGLLGPSVAAEAAAFVFALHPVHAESVAWLAGIKDVLALLFTGVALAAYVRSPLDGRRRAAVVLCVLLACFSKAVSVVSPGLLLFTDAWIGRRPDRGTLVGSLVVAAGAAALHASIGARVGMYAAMPGGSRLAALATMAPVAFRYVLHVVPFEPSSIVYEVPDRTLADPVSLAALAGLALAIGLAALAFRRGERRPLLLIGFVLVALAPVSQVLAPIQHRMADRYLFVALAAPCIALAIGLGRIAKPRAQVLVGAVLALVLALLTGLRATTLASPTTLWVETSELAPTSPLGPYQLAVALEHTRPDVAEQAYREALARDEMRSDTGRRAADNLAILLARSARTDEAIALLAEAHARYPRDPRVGHNLAVLLDARGEHARARELLLHVLEDAPHYARAWASYRARWGEPPLTEPAPLRYDAGDRAP